MSQWQQVRGWVLNSACQSTIRTLLLALALQSCTTASNDRSEDILSGTIDYPFASRASPLGHNGPEDKFVIKSTVGATEYVLEIPGAARDYDIEVPLADLKNAGAIDTASGSMNGNFKPQYTDRELVKAMPKLPTPNDQGLVEGAFGVGQAEGPTQSPSYTLHIAKINKLYLGKQYEYALIEINNLLTYYPTSPKLHKMKGTILLKLRNYQLAERAWARGYDLAPNDLALKKGLESLRRRLESRQSQSQVTPPTTAH